MWVRGATRYRAGSTTNQTSLLAFKRGAFVAGVPVQPVAVRMPYDVIDPSWANDGLHQGTLLLWGMCRLHLPVGAAACLCVCVCVCDTAGRLQGGLRPAAGAHACARA
jgi:hypothetical protein